jgi:hypothetical protein
MRAAGGGAALHERCHPAAMEGDRGRGSWLQMTRMRRIACLAVLAFVYFSLMYKVVERLVTVSPNAEARPRKFGVRVTSRRRHRRWTDTDRGSRHTEKQRLRVNDEEDQRDDLRCGNLPLPKRSRLILKYNHDLLVMERELLNCTTVFWRRPITASLLFMLRRRGVGAIISLTTSQGRESQKLLADRCRTISDLRKHSPTAGLPIGTRILSNTSDPVIPPKLVGS